jgi:dihydrofolate synthase / folylpolyglutamate synthase
MDDATLRAKLDGLFARRTFGIKLGLHVEEALLGRLGDPQRAFGVVHVAGTNGKGSVCAIVASILRRAGYCTGLYTSPHLVHVNERICVDGAPIADGDLAALFADVEPVAAAVARELGQEATFFEFTTAMAFEHFRRKNVRVAVVEVGMGGRLDATNVVQPLVSVITRIALEHTRYLGPDLASIAREKGGIIKPRRPVVLGAMAEEPLAVLRAIAAERHAPVVHAPEQMTVGLVAEDVDGMRVRLESANATYGRCRLPLTGRHQMDNLATAVCAVEVLPAWGGLEVDEEAVRGGVARVAWPGRLQVVSRDPLVLVDGAHNPDAGAALAETLPRLLARRPLALIVGMCEDKDVPAFLRTVGGLAQARWVVPLNSERGLPPERLRALVRECGWDAAVASVPDALQQARAWAAANGGAVCATGSLFLVGEILATLESHTCDQQ